LRHAVAAAAAAVPAAAARRARAPGPSTREFHTPALIPIHLADRILSITHVLVLDEREARRLARDPDAPQRPVPLEIIAQIPLSGSGVEAAHIQAGLRGHDDSIPQTGRRCLNAKQAKVRVLPQQHNTDSK
jgi:hypothetical protein